jgi:hypothetical protein
MPVIMAKTRRKCSNRKRIEKLSVTMATLRPMKFLPQEVQRHKQAFPNFR